MIVLTMTSCPPALRGDLTAWLLEIDPCVFVGQVGARVRDELWARIQKHIGTGRATMVFSTQNEQRLGFYVHNASWEPISFDGLKLMLRPAPIRGGSSTGQDALRPGFSKAAAIQKTKRFAGSTAQPQSLAKHVIIMDLETTGLNPAEDQIIEMGALEVNAGEICGSYHALVQIKGRLPPAITRLTGIQPDDLTHHGRPLREALEGFLAFAGELPIVSHRSAFDMSFLRVACKKEGIVLTPRHSIDTYQLARKWLPSAPNWKLTTLAAHLDIQISGAHRSIDDCLTTKQLYDKLIELSES